MGEGVQIFGAPNDNDYHLGLKPKETRMIS
jgi:hypothetical protein